MRKPYKQTTKIIDKKKECLSLRKSSAKVKLYLNIKTRLDDPFFSEGKQYKNLIKKNNMKE